MKKILSFCYMMFSMVALVAQKPSLPVVVLPQIPRDTVSIKKYGAVADGIVLNTNQIQRAINELSKKGGGVVLIPPGLWLTGPIELRSKINLHLSLGATLMFTADFTQYPLVKANWEGLPQMRNQSPISATEALHIAITGKGIIDGNGDAWRMVKKDKLNESHWKKLISSGGVLSEDKKTWYPSLQSLRGSNFVNPGHITSDKSQSFFDSIKDFLRPNLLLLTKCKFVLLEGVTFQNSAAWCLHPLMSEHLTVRNINVKNPWYAQNGDGIDVESCQNVLIENSIFDVGDDALCMKSGRDAAGRARAMPTQKVIIRGCTVYASHGGFVIGSEMSGGVNDIFVNNCTFIGTDIGLRFKSTRGRGGVVQNIYINDIYMKDIVGEAILFDMYYAAKDPIPLVGENREVTVAEFKSVDETTPVFKNFYISNVFCSGAEKAIFIRGLPEMPIQNIVFDNMRFKTRKGIEVQESSLLTFRNIHLTGIGSTLPIDVLQSQQVKFDGVLVPHTPEAIFRIGGDRTQKIILNRLQENFNNDKILYRLGANPSMVNIQ